MRHHLLTLRKAFLAIGGPIITLNAQRRDLTAAQRTIVAARTLPHFEEVKRPGPNNAGKSSPQSGRARDDATAVFKVSDKSVQQAKALLTDAPDLAVQVAALAEGKVAWLAGQRNQDDAGRAAAVLGGFLSVPVESVPRDRVE